MLIVEGPDGAGKTSLVQRLTEDLEWPVAPKAVSPDMAAAMPLTAWVDMHLANKFQAQIFDRFVLISEQIYMPITRDLPRPELEPMWFFDRWKQLLALRPIMIWCLPPLSAVENNVLGEDLQPDIVQSFIDKIYWSYFHRWITWVHSPNLRWDYTGAEAPNDYDDLLRRTRHYIEGALT